MHLRQRSISGHTTRPKPIVSSEDGELIVIATPWGDSEAAVKAIKNVTEFMQMTDGELATDVVVMERLRAAFLATNELIYIHENRVEYRAAVELLAIHHSKGVLTWTQSGNPSLFLATRGQMIPISYNLDWAFQVEQDSPLPAHCLGLEKTPLIQAGSYNLRSENHLVVLSASNVPKELYLLEDAQFEQVEALLHQANTGSPVWFGVIDL